MKKCIKKLSDKRKVFSSEADLQLELAMIIQSEYPKAKIRCEYVPNFDAKKHVDILVIIDNKWFPIELKYKTRDAVVEDYDGEKYSLKYHGAKDINCYAYIKDIQRIEKIRDSLNNSDAYPNFGIGYTVFITNDESYTKKPRKDAYYRKFSLDNGKHIML